MQCACTPNMNQTSLEGYDPTQPQHYQDLVLAGVRGPRKYLERASHNLSLLCCIFLSEGIPASITSRMAHSGGSPRRSMEIQTKPWKYIGYPAFALWLSSDNDFFLIRRFDALNARVILMLQWEISVLESKLTL